MGIQFLWSFNLVILVFAFLFASNGSIFVSSRPQTDNLEAENPAPSCGQTKAMTEIINSTKTEIIPHSFPWVAALLYKKDNENFCGGVIVSPTKIVTAAHCIREKKRNKLEPSDIKVVVGMHDMKKLDEPQVQTLNVQKAHLHEDWNHELSGCYKDDIAVLILDSKIKFNGDVQPVCLASGTDIDAIQKIENGLVIGYRRNINGASKDLTVPKSLLLPIHGYDACIKKYKDLETVAGRASFCAGNATGEGVCKGDSGNAFVVYHEHAFYLRGVVSSSLRNRGRENCDMNKYGVYADALRYEEFITRKEEEYEDEEEDDSRRR